MKIWKMIIIVLFLIGLFACVVIGNMDMHSGSNAPSDKVIIYNGTGNGDGSFICKMTYNYGANGVTDNFNISVVTDGRWSAYYEDGFINIVNEDNNAIRHVNMTCNGKEFAIDENEPDDANTVGLFKIKYEGNLASISLYS